MSENDECYNNEDGCLPNCQCDLFTGWKPSGKKDGKCIHPFLGNGKLDDLYSSVGFLRKEECDSGLNCDEYGFCIDGDWYCEECLNEEFRKEIVA